MTLDQSNNGTRRPAFEVGDKVEHTNSHRIGAVQEICPRRDGTFKLRVHVHAMDTWWNSRYVRNLTAEEEKEPDHGEGRGEMKTPKLVLTSAKAASVTYSFVTEGEGFKSWALCTVNDQTGELLITSDWGSWSHRWHASPEALGASSLTAFIGTRGDVDYLARKLQSEGRNGVRFSVDGTARELHRLLCARRLEDGREQLERRLEPEDYDGGRLPNHLMDRYTEAGLPIFGYHEVDSPTWQDPTRKEPLPYLTAEAARTLWDEIDETIGECSPSTDLMFDRLLRLSGFVEYVTDEPWNHVETEQTPEDRALRDIVLPALIEACRTAALEAKDRLEALRAFVAGYVASRPEDGPLGQEAEDKFNRWWNDPSVAKVRAERRGKGTPT